MGELKVGVLFAIDRMEAGKPRLEEGLGKGYERIDDFPIERVENGETVRAATYLATKTDPALKPMD